MSINEESTEIVPFRSSGYLTINFSLPSERNLNLKHLKGISNAWQRGVMVDLYGRIWVCESELHNILRTTKDDARYYLLNIKEQYQLEVGNKIYVQGSEIYRLLDIILQSAGSIRREKYLRFSEEIYKAIRDSAQVKTIRSEFYETIQFHKKNLKQIRIRQLKLTEDELTGFQLDKNNSEFSHIRSSQNYLYLADKYWNGLVVNKDTHNIITKEAVKDEEQLLNLCMNYGWNTEWYDIFSQCLNSY